MWFLGKAIQHEEGVLCQARTVHPGMECKFSTGTGEASGWYAVLIALIRRLIMDRNELVHETNSKTMKKALINFQHVDRAKAIIFMTSLKKFYMTRVSSHYSKRMAAPAGQILDEYLKDCAAMLKRMFVRESESRVEKARRRTNRPIEADRCFKYLKTANDGTILRFCTNCKEVSCPINLLMARYMARTTRFISDYNGVRGSRMILKDFFRRDEIDIFTRHFLEDNRPIGLVGEYGEGVAGIADEVTERTTPHRFR